MYFKDFNLSLLGKLNLIKNTIYSFDARKNLENLIRDTKPDIALFLNAHYFSDSIVDACRYYNLPIIWRLSDYQKICASYVLYRNNHVCEECLVGNSFQSVVSRCGGLQHSLGAALVRYTGMQLSKFRKIYNYVNYFITPSQFTRQKMIQGGFDGDKMVCIPTFITLKESVPCTNPYGILYVGRLSQEKGVHVLIDAFKRLKNKGAVLTIVGDTNSDYARSLQSIASEDSQFRIHFTGYKSQAEITELFRNHAFFVVPSLCYDNLPNVLLEGMANGRPAIVSALGSLTETVKDGETGCHFEAGNPEALANKMEYLLANPTIVHEMGEKAHSYVKVHHSPEKHIAALESLLYSCINERK